VLFSVFRIQQPAAAAVDPLEIMMMMMMAMMMVIRTKTKINHQQLLLLQLQVVLIGRHLLYKIRMETII